MSIEKGIETVGPPWAQIPSRDLDCETAALMRAMILPLFAGAGSWAGLADTLRQKGYRLAFQNGCLCVLDRATGSRVCGLRFLGIEFRDLVRRMGRPVVVPRGSGADGDLLDTRPAERP